MTVNAQNLREWRKSRCCSAKIDATLADGILIGSCSKCGKVVVRVKPGTRTIEDLSGHEFNPFYDVPAF